MLRVKRTRACQVNCAKTLMVRKNQCWSCMPGDRLFPIFSSLYIAGCYTFYPRCFFIHLLVVLSDAHTYCTKIIVRKWAWTYAWCAKQTLYLNLCLLFLYAMFLSLTCQYFWPKVISDHCRLSSAIWKWQCNICQNANVGQVSVNVRAVRVKCISQCLSSYTFSESNIFSVLLQLVWNKRAETSRRPLYMMTLRGWVTFRFDPSDSRTFQIQLHNNYNIVPCPGYSILIT